MNRIVVENNAIPLHRIIVLFQQFLKIAIMLINSTVTVTIMDKYYWFMDQIIANLAQRMSVKNGNPSIERFPHQAL